MNTRTRRGSKSAWSKNNGSGTIRRNLYPGVSLVIKYDPHWHHSYYTAFLIINRSIFYLAKYKTLERAMAGCEKNASLLMTGIIVKLKMARVDLLGHDPTDTIEPGQRIANVLCPGCGCNLEIVHGEEVGQIGAYYSSKSDEDDRELTNGYMGVAQ